MRTLSAAELMDVWEAGREASPLDQAALLLLAAFPDLSWQAVEALPVGRKDALLIRLRESLFGAAMESVAVCPACGERLSFTFTGADLAAQEGPHLGPETYPESPEQVSIKQDGYAVTVRLPTGADVRAAAGRGDRLFSQIVVDATHDGKPVGAGKLPEVVVDAVAGAIKEADPLAEVSVALTCPACQHGWSAPFDVTTFFWRELEAWVRRTLQMVHALASRYGWREADILAMSAWRRRQYLEMGSA